MATKTSLIISLSAMALLIGTGASADDTKKTVYDQHNQVITSKGGCVLTQWDAANNPCTPEPPPPPPAPVAQPAPPPPPPPAPKISREELTVYFDFDKAALSEEGQNKLKHVADVINASPQILKVNIVGYTDQIGTSTYNDKLSMTRAGNVKGYLDTLARIPSEVQGLRALGMADPVVQCDPKMKRKDKIACEAKNRRVEVEFEYQE